MRFLEGAFCKYFIALTSIIWYDTCICIQVWQYRVYEPRTLQL